MRVAALFDDAAAKDAVDVAFSALMPQLSVQATAALDIAQWLAARSEVATVLHPALPSCPGHEIWKRDFTGASGLFSTAAGVSPSQVVKLHTLFAQGKRGEALALSLAVLPVFAGQPRAQGAQEVLLHVLTHFVGHHHERRAGHENPRPAMPVPGLPVLGERAHGRRKLAFSRTKTSSWLRARTSK